MKCVILAGGYGTRISEETVLRPKPMIDIGDKPILWHIMKLYSYYGINEFIICLGYKGYMIKEYFANYFLHNSDVTFNLPDNTMAVHSNYSEPWTVTLINTGIDTATGGRLKRIQQYVGDETFCFTYGDGISDVNIRELIEFHEYQKVKATLTSVQPPGRYGALNVTGNKIKSFIEKPEEGNGWINGGFFVMSPQIFDYIEDDQSSWEGEPLEHLALDGQLCAYKHIGFWHAMDMLRDKVYLEALWKSGKAPWKIWDNT